MPLVKVKSRNKIRVSWLPGSLLTIRCLNEFPVKFSPAVLSHVIAECVAEREERSKREREVMFMMKSLFSQGSISCWDTTAS